MKNHLKPLKGICEEIGLEKDELRLIKNYGPINISDSYKGDNFDWEIYVIVFIIIKKVK